MAESTLSTPLLPSIPSKDPPDFALTIDSDLSSHSSNEEFTQSQSTNHHPHQNPNSDPQNPNLGFEFESDPGNPFRFLAVDGVSVPDTCTVDPFRNHTWKIEGVYEWFKIFVCLPIALVRLVLFGLALVVGYLATLIALQGWKDRHNPMPRWRCRIMWVTRLSARCILFSFGYHWIKRKRRPASRDIAPIVVSNHVSYIEPIFFFYELFPTIVASESHDSIPFVGTIIRAMQVIYVNRFSPPSRKHAVNEIKRKASCNKFPRVLLFPEGTTTNGRVLISFQLGAFIPGYPIQPVVVRYPYVHFDQSWGHISLAKLMFRMFTQFHNFMEVEYLPVVQPLENQKENAFHFAERTARVIATALNVVQTSHAYGDLMLLTRAAQSKQENPSVFMVEMAKIESAYQISTMEAVEFLDKFLSMNPDSNGRVKAEGFYRALRLTPCALSANIFAFVDGGKDRKITFKQFLLASVCVRNQPFFRQACESAFAKCSTSEENNFISEEQFGDAIRLAIPNMNHEEMRLLFEMFDIDRDERINQVDFDGCLRRNPLLIAIFSPLLEGDLLQTSNVLLEEMV